MSDDLDALIDRAAARSHVSVLRFVPPPASSRRRRLWELDAHTHCPVVGACIPIDVLRRMAERLSLSVAELGDYELHCSAMCECKSRTPLADALQKELERRYLLPVRQSAAAKTAAALAEWWQRAHQSADIPGAVWAALTHARCTPALEYQVLGDLHMAQHQIGAAQRIEAARFDALQRENAASRSELATLQDRHQRQAVEHERRCIAQEATLVEARAELAAREVAIVTLRSERAMLDASIPDLESRIDLSLRHERDGRRIAELERELTEARRDAERQRRRADDAVRALAAGEHAGASFADPAIGQTPSPPRLDDRAVLCVGGRPASVPLYRHIVERTGGRFLHHDGGEEESVLQLDASLASADLVICQTGCISHGAYWRVKEHCKRTGTPCVFVENPGTSSLKRALAEWKPVVVAAQRSSC